MSDTDDDGDAATVDRRSALILDRLFRSEVPHLIRYVRRRITRQDEAYDLVQEAFTRFAGARPATISGKPEAYLQQILRNLLINRAKRKEVRLAAHHVPVDEAYMVPIAPEQGWVIEADEMLARCHAALDQLPERTKEVFLLHRADELSYTDIASRLGVTVKAIEYHMGKALAHLARSLRAE